VVGVHIRGAARERVACCPEPVALGAKEERRDGDSLETPERLKSRPLVATRAEQWCSSGGGSAASVADAVGSAFDLLGCPLPASAGGDARAGLGEPLGVEIRKRGHVLTFGGESRFFSTGGDA
jgi:hypothetical protein